MTDRANSSRRPGWTLAIDVAGLALALSGVAATAQPAAEPTAREKVEIESAFSKSDLNADGRLTKDEASAWPAVVQRFGEFDVNRDGALSFVEFALAYPSATVR